MTVTLKNEIVETQHGNFYVYIDQEKFETTFKVGIAKEIAPGLCTYPINEIRYNEMDKAKRRYAYLKREAKKGRW